VSGCEDCAAVGVVTFVDYARVEFDGDGSADQFAQESGWVLGFSCFAVLHGCVLERAHVVVAEDRV
jgi:hypothetical protein